MLQMNTWQHAWTIIVIVLAGGILAGKLTERPRIPDVAAYLLLGIILGPAALQWIHQPIESDPNQFILNLAATLILFDGGRSIDLGILRQTWLTVTLLATSGVLVSATIVGAAAHWILGLPWGFCLLLGAVVASTDPATLIPVFKRVRVFPRLQQTVEAESAFNDATAAVLVFTILTALETGQSVHILQSIANFLQSAGSGLVIGSVCGIAALWLLSPKGWGILHEYGSVVLLLAALGSYTAAQSIHGSGFMAAFTAGVIAGNGRVFGWTLAPLTTANADHFGNAITLVMRMLIFVLLGTQVDFAAMGQYLVPALLLVGVLMFVARPATVLSAVGLDRRARWTAREVWFMFWVRETGVIPAALTGMLAARGAAHTDVLLAVTFLAILVTILVQATSTGWVAARLGVAQPVPAMDEDV